jgi:uncharacterized SAM-binding protein YcdF (DUF218 family)
MIRPESDAIVTLGRDLDPDGQLGNTNLIRLQTAIELFRAGIAPHLIMSGGGRLSLENPLLTEAKQMKAYAISQGVPAEVVFTEERSLDTIGNAVYTRKQLLEQRDWQRLTVVTSEWHLERSLRAFRHVLSTEYQLQGIGAPERPSLRDLRGEKRAIKTLETVLAGVPRGDIVTAEQRLHAHLPLYVELTQAYAQAA